MVETAHAEQPTLRYKSYKEVREAARETEADARVLEAIWGAWRQGHVPTIRYLRDAADLKTTSHARYILKKLASLDPPKVIIMQQHDGGVLTVWPTELLEEVTRVIKEIDNAPRE